MIDNIRQILTVTHFFALGMLFLYGLHRLWFVSLWYLERKRGTHVLPGSTISGDHPFVTIHLPVYNERFVVKRLIDACANINWPKERLEIQILDDSDDDTGEIVDERATYWAGRQVRLQILRRGERTGYKAGALNHGLQCCSGEFVAIFDADFVPPPDFLLRTIPWFRDTSVGMVQTRWDFLNRNHSWLTRLQAILLGAHFSIEHWVRFRRGLFFNFNGTAGVWRKAAIESAGGWKHDTVTEDLDLSYRAQLTGWKFVYLDDVAVPSELPSTIWAFRRQQQRWAKGSIQTARKILPMIIQSDIPRRIKIEAGVHLLSNLGWFFGTVITLTLFPAIVSRTGIGPYEMMRIDLPFFLGTTCLIMFFFFVYARQYEGKESIAYVALLPFFSVAVAPSIALSVMKGLVVRGGVFDRTPKFGLHGTKVLPKRAFLYTNGISSYIFLTLLFLLYSLMPFSYALERKTWFALPLLGIFSMGFLGVMVGEISEMSLNAKRKRETKGGRPHGRAPF